MVKKEKEVTKKKKLKSKKKETKVVKKKEKSVTTFKGELKKIKWPTKKEMIKYSIATIAFVVFFAIFFYIIEVIMAFLKSML